MAQRQWRSDDTDKWLDGFGNGSDGSTYAAPANAGASGTSGTTSLTISTASTFADGDLVIIHQTRGDNTDPNWELNKIASGGGTTSLTMAYDLTRTYTDSGANQAQIVEMKSYNNLNLASGAINPTDWDGNLGGLVGWFDKGTTSGTSATINLAGSTGATASVTTGTSAVTTGGGFSGGYGRQTGTSGSGRQGEGYSGAGSESSSANGNGGGAAFGTGGPGSASGGGGGNGTAGTTGTSDEQTDGSGGGTSGNASLTIAQMGGGGGGCYSRDGATQTVASGGSGGGLGFIFANNLDLTGITFTFNGGAGGNGSRKGDGGGGAGGSCLIKCVIATLGTNKITATGGAGGATFGGAGGTGRIHIDYSKSYSGSTSPGLDVRQDNTIKATIGGANYYQYFL